MCYAPTISSRRLDYSFSFRFLSSALPCVHPAVLLRHERLQTGGLHVRRPPADFVGAARSRFSVLSRHSKGPRGSKMDRGSKQRVGRQYRIRRCPLPPTFSAADGSLPAVGASVFLTSVRTCVCTRVCGLACMQHLTLPSPLHYVASPFHNSRLQLCAYLLFSHTMRGALASACEAAYLVECCTSPSVPFLPSRLVSLESSDRFLIWLLSSVLAVCSFSSPLFASLP